MLSLAPSATGVATLRVRGAGRDGPALRLAASSRLAGADLRPPGLPPATVLVVRRMADPGPGRFSVRRREPGIDREWERRARKALEEAAARAARPRRGRLPPEADAVLFRDGAELLACLASAASGGGAAREWWRPAVARFLSLRSEEGPAAVLRSAPRELPAALADLAAWGRAREVLAELPAAACAGALAELAATHGLAPELLPEDDRAPAGPVPRQATPRGGETPTLRPNAPPGAPLPEPPWRPWVPAATEDGLGRGARALLGIALALHRAPGEVRSGRFAQGVARWWRGAGGELPDPEAPTPPLVAGGSPPPPGSAAHPAVRTPHPEPRGWLQRADRAGVEARPPAPRGAAEGSLPGPGATRSPGAATPADGGEAADAPTRSRPAPEPVAGAPIRLPKSEGAGAPGLAEAPAEEDREDAGAALDPGLPTRIGGLLYLLHLMTRLGLPGVFDADWGLGRSPGAWGVLELLARGLLEGVEAGFPDDPAWPALTALAGREPGTLPTCGPTCGWEGPPAYRLPPAWLPVLREHGLLEPDDRFAWAAAGGRLRVWRGTDWPLVDRSLDGARPAELARRELACALGEGPFALRRAPFREAPVAEPADLLGAGLEPTLGLWLGAVLPLVELLLDRLAGPFEAPGAAVAALLPCPGRLHVTPTHVDLVAPLDAISLPARRAGLDRNPGWLPDFGRIVSFHFEDGAPP